MPPTCSFRNQPFDSYASAQRASMQTGADPLDLVGLTRLMKLTSGRAEVMVGLIDGPVDFSHPALAIANIREVPGRLGGVCKRADSIACMHGTFVAGILSAKRGSAAPAICPDCTLLVRPIFAEGSGPNEEMPSATPQELATAIIDCIEGGAHVINVSAALTQPSSTGERKLEEALDYSARRGVIVVAAAGNQGAVGSSVITRHPWVIPVIACDLRGRPIGYSNFGNSIGRRGLSAPGDRITSLSANGQSLKFGGTSAAAPFVTGTIALLRSEFRAMQGSQVKLSVACQSSAGRRSIVPPMLDAWGAYKRCSALHERVHDR